MPPMLRGCFWPFLPLPPHLGSLFDDALEALLLAMSVNLGVIIWMALFTCLACGPAASTLPWPAALVAPMALVLGIGLVPCIFAGLGLAWRARRMLAALELHRNRWAVGLAAAACLMHAWRAQVKAAGLRGDRGSEVIVGRQQGCTGASPNPKSQIPKRCAHLINVTHSVQCTTLPAWHAAPRPRSSSCWHREIAVAHPRLVVVGSASSRTGLASGFTSLASSACERPLPAGSRAGAWRSAGRVPCEVPGATAARSHLLIVHFVAGTPPVVD